MSTFKRPLKELDVWYCQKSILRFGQHKRLTQCIAQLANTTMDFFCPKYQNVIDPNLFLYYDDNNINNQDVECAASGKWVATNVQVKLDQTTKNVKLSGSIQNLPKRQWYPLYSTVNTMLNKAYSLLCQIKNWKKYNQLESVSKHYGDHIGGEYPLFQNQVERHPFAMLDHFQVVVKCQRVIVEPGMNYKGLWHDEGLNENIIAVIVYYTDVSKSLEGGEIQFASKGGCGAVFGSHSNLRKAWKERDKICVPIQTGTTVVFSNYQTVHRVLEIENTSTTPQAREFVCLFVVDPRTPLQSTQRYDITYMALQEQCAMWPYDIAKIIFGYDDHPTESRTLLQRKELRKAVFTEQMKPKILGTFLKYSTGNGDCQTVGWASAEQSDYGRPLYGTETEPLSTDDDERSCQYDYKVKYLFIKRERIEMNDEQTVSF